MAVATKATFADTYMELIIEFPLRRIKAAALHAKAIKLSTYWLSNPADWYGPKDIWEQ